MPNHITNRIKFYGKQENIDKVLSLISGEKTHIDFEKIIPMPEHIYRGNLGQEEREIYGSDNWYDWCINNWGTKWNAYHTTLDERENVLEFDTAWSCPTWILEALAKLCYEYGVSFDGEWADEDCGNNVGTFESVEDEFYYEYVNNGSNEAYEIYVSLKGEHECLGRDDDGNWVMYSCDNCPNPC